MGLTGLFPETQCWLWSPSLHCSTTVSPGAAANACHSTGGKQKQKQETSQQRSVDWTDGPPCVTAVEWVDRALDRFALNKVLKRTKALLGKRTDSLESLLCCPGEAKEPKEAKNAEEAQEEGRRQRRQGKLAEEWSCPATSAGPLQVRAGNCPVRNCSATTKSLAGVLRSLFLCQVGSLDYHRLCPSHWQGWAASLPQSLSEPLSE